jgi:hypothetical protein
MVAQTFPSQTERPENSQPVERRAWVRFPSDREAGCRIVSSADAEEAKTGWPGRMRNASPGGLALMLKRRFEPGSVLIVELAAKKERLRLLVRVVYVRAQNKGRWIVGCAFASPLSEEELQDVLYPWAISDIPAGEDSARHGSRL